MPVSVALEASDLVAAAKDVTAALPEQEALKEGLSLDPDQVALWREAAPAIAERFAVDAGQALSINVLSVIYGYLVKNRYLLNLMERSAKISKARIQKIIETKYPDTLGDTASQLIKRELEKKLSGHTEEDQEEGTEEKGKKEGKPLAVYVEVEAKQLKDAERVSTLKLHLQEGTLEGMTFSEVEEVSGEERQAAREDT